MVGGLNTFSGDHRAGGPRKRSKWSKFIRFLRPLLFALAGIKMIHRTGPLDCRQFALRILLVQMTVAEYSCRKDGGQVEEREEGLSEGEESR